jgi:ketosteroid isomerase-like protein
MQATNQKAIERLVEAINTGNLALMDEVFHDDAVMEWPQSGERVVGAENRRAIYSRFPTLPQISPRRLLAADDLVVLEARLDYGGPVYDTVFIFELRDGKITRETAYWSEPFAAPEWRAPWVEPI